MQYTPSALEAKDANVLVEGKSDFYILSWYKKNHGENLKLNFLPVNGVTNASAVLSLLLGWAKDFVFLHDSDAEGKAAKKRYQAELPISLEHFAEYEDIFGSEKTSPKQIEGLLSANDKAKIAKFYDTKKVSKSQIQRYFSSSLVGKDAIELDEQSLSNLAKLTHHLMKMLAANEN